MTNPAMTLPAHTLYLEDLAVGQRYATQGRTITEADLVLFAGWSWDTNPVHTDATYAASGRFGERIGHGLLGLSIAMGLVSRLAVFERSAFAFLGIDDWNFRAPIRIGDTLRCVVEVVGVRPTREAGVLHRRLTLLNQADEVVQEGVVAVLVARRPETAEPGTP